MGKESPAMQEIQKMWVPSLGGNDPLRKGMATQNQYSCLENSIIIRAWWATGHGVAKSWT